MTQRRRWLTRLVKLAVALVCAFVIMRLVGTIDWGTVRDALGHLSWWQPPVLLVVLAVRQVLNASPLHFFVDGLSFARATQNDVAAILMQMIAPSPGDFALRVMMFTSWGIPAARGAAGTVMNTLTFWVVRFSAPMIGFVLLAVVGGDVASRWADLISVAIAAGIVVGVVLVLHSDPLARTIGLGGGKVVRRFRRTVDPEAWAQSCVDFRAHIAFRFRYGFPRSLAATVGALAMDLALLVLCLRFVGVAASDASIADIAIAYLFAYPLTLFPFAGLGILDALIVAALVESGGAAVEAPAVAGLLVWRVFTLGVPVLAGVGAVALWRRTSNGWSVNPATALRPPQQPPDPPRHR
jgi:uncharacterized membrane protein YbhN (UPF0104 family)